MAKAEFDLARLCTRQFVQETGLCEHMFYGPTSDEYWSAPLRVLAVNMEPYGCAGGDVDLDELLGWMFDDSKTGTKTVRKTFSFIRTLLDAYTADIVPTREHLKMAYSDSTELKAIAKRAVYYNIRSISNTEKEQDVASIVASGSSPIADFTRREMLALEPHVILVSGQAGLTAFNTMWQLAPRLCFLTGCRYSDSTFIQSIRHPSRSNYEEYASTITNVVRAIKPVA